MDVACEQLSSGMGGLAQLPNLPRVAATQEVFSWECWNGGEYLDPQENWVHRRCGTESSTKSCGAIDPISPCIS